MKALWVILITILLLDLFFVWCCCQATGRYDDAENQWSEECTDGGEASDLYFCTASSSYVILSPGGVQPCSEEKNDTSSAFHRLRKSWYATASWS